jgi:hypothetical protein
MPSAKEYICYHGKLPTQSKTDDTVFGIRNRDTRESHSSGLYSVDDILDIMNQFRKLEPNIHPQPIHTHRNDYTEDDISGFFENDKPYQIGADESKPYEDDEEVERILHDEPEICKGNLEKRAQFFFHFLESTGKINDLDGIGDEFKYEEIPKLRTHPLWSEITRESDIPDDDTDEPSDEISDSPSSNAQSSTNTPTQSDEISDSPSSTGTPTQSDEISNFLIVKKKIVRLYNQISNNGAFDTVSQWNNFVKKPEGVYFRRLESLPRRTTTTERKYQTPKKWTLNEWEKVIAEYLEKYPENYVVHTDDEDEMELFFKKYFRPYKADNNFISSKVYTHTNELFEALTREYKDVVETHELSTPSQQSSVSRTPQSSARRLLDFSGGSKKKKTIRKRSGRKVGGSKNKKSSPKPKPKISNKNKRSGRTRRNNKKGGGLVSSKGYKNDIEKLQTDISLFKQFISNSQSEANRLRAEISKKEKKCPKVKGRPVECYNVPIDELKIKLEVENNLISHYQQTLATQKQELSKLQAEYEEIKKLGFERV